MDAATRTKTSDSSLAILQDFGKGWTNLTANSNGAIASFWDFDWGANIHRSERRSFPDETILATVYEKAGQMKGLTPGWDKDMHFVHSTDFFKSAHTRLAACGNQFEVIGHKVCNCNFYALELLNVTEERYTFFLPCCWHVTPGNHRDRILVVNLYLLQVFLALPTNCPTDPDGSPRSTDGQIKADSVVLYASADEAQTFEQVFLKPVQLR